KIVLLAGSVHKDEDVRIVDAFSQAQKRRGELVMIIAPRHMDRVEEINKRCLQHGLETCRRTTIQAGSHWTVLILDTLGELASLYAICDAALLGGSLIPWGGQNLLEPAYYGKPLFFGPHMYNFKALSELFVENGAAQVIQDEEELSDLLVAITEEKMSDMGIRAKETLQSLRGATDKTLEVLEKMIITDTRSDC
ncbi:3-deoxy-D-manno-octulosonic acid transferase, partial [Acidobacteriota bacterium]